MPEKATVPAAPVTNAGATKPSAEPSSGAPVTGALPEATAVDKACTWTGEKAVKLTAPPKSQSSISPVFAATPLATAACRLA